MAQIYINITYERFEPDKFEVSSSNRSKVMASKPKSKMAAGGHLGF